MLLPIGHEEDSVRRWPWISIGIVALCLLVHLSAHQNRQGLEERSFQALYEALEYYWAHPHLELDPRLAPFSPSFEEMEAAIEEEGGDAEWLREFFPGGDETPGPALTGDQQAELDRLSQRYFDLIDQLPEFRWGLVPIEGDPTTYVTSIFLHGGWIHLLGNLFFLWLAGPALEDRWGRPFFLGFYLLCGIVPNLLWVARYPDSAIPLIGASGAIAGLMGAFAVRLWNTKIRFFYFFFFFWRPITGTFMAPAWLMLGLWVGREFFWADAADELMGSFGGTAYWVHVWGFLFGVVVAAVLRYSKAEEKHLARQVEASLGTETNQPLEEAYELRQEGRLEEAWQRLQEGLRQKPRDVDLALAMWDLAEPLDRAKEAAAPMLRAIRLELRQGEHDTALAHWRELEERVPEVPLDLDLRLRLAEAQLKEGDDEEAAELLAEVGGNLDLDLPSGILARLARAAVDARSPSAPIVAKAALGRQDLPEPVREEIEEGLERLRAFGVRERRATASSDTAANAPIPVSGHEPIPVSGEAPIPLATESVPQRQLQVMAAVPQQLNGQKIALDVAGQGRRLLPLANVQALAAARIEEPAAPPWVVIDLLVDAPWGDRPKVRTVRLESRQFDAAALGAVSGGTLEALLADLLASSGATPMPDPEAARGRPFKSFASVAEYQREVLGL